MFIVATLRIDCGTSIDYLDLDGPFDTRDKALDKAQQIVDDENDGDEDEDDEDDEDDDDEDSKIDRHEGCHAYLGNNIEVTIIEL